MEDFIYYNGKKYRKGYTTGTCAAAAAKACAQMILTQEEVSLVQVETTGGQILEIPVAKQQFSKTKATAAVQKDGGDDIDATHGMWIFVDVELTEENKIHLDGGIGIGRATQKGISVAVGEAAINPAPRKNIIATMRDSLGETRGANIVIYAPEGEERAKRTMNSNLGIVGGISILGTTGIVTPMSDEGWKKSLSIELEMKRTQGMEQIILVPGNYGDDFVQNTLGFSNNQVVSMSNFVGYMLKETQRLAFKRVLMVGHFGKLVKVSAGIFTTYSKDADARAEILVANLALLGAPISLLEEVEKCNTTEAAGELIEAAGYSHVYDVIVQKIKARSERFLKFTKPSVEIDVVTFSTERGLLASTKDIEVLREEWQ
ncbi:cobalt-precorrin-5B (C(1))-methyltransferase [Listeria sp. FSL L7-1485]|uniref:Cobalt-precorrin-5B C(1)-methyltransferase n=1 Tax=Listeria immobilis TaxID=2713502 RepID=A0A7X0XAC3_9LIST|nr:cobalt-precorrin-5B (C(1))-methyltransferase CbiD [Listeria immobilis]MBC1490061.1 cobalt-precorrin-5B (C(1))-methyltransferase [Listeria immobilis]MBC1537176.1 cobalt-precorrin-5B (C(1))-methyltransferase [Listeria immobilis]MBC6297810.1 cobalt-precorrin-5B (C(1))-methyltransferase [Listeria immobilis]